MTNAQSISYHDAGVSALWVVGLTMTEIAHVLDISPRVVEHRIARMRERGILAGSLRRWSLAEVDLLRTMAATGLTDEEMAAELGRSTISIIRKRHRIGARRVA
ncbi:MAG: hypothetical protein IPK79_00990 [Vampirovibrionales bacterium]|nr:hypothetical protein [Vampirovibrionales bacterium]